MSETVKNTQELEVQRLEMLSVDCLVDYILNLGAQATKIESDMNLASRVLEESYGLTIEAALQQRAES